MTPAEEESGHEIVSLQGVVNGIETGSGSEDPLPGRSPYATV